MTAPSTTRRSFYPTPAWLIYGLLVVEGLLWLSERYTWFWFNEKKGWTVLVGVGVVGVVMIVMLLWFVVALVFRWRFQFSIRSLLVLTVAVALPFSWLAVEMKKTREQDATVDEIGKLGGRVYYEYQCDPSGEPMLDPFGEPLINAQPQVPIWLQTLLGSDFFREVSRADLCDPNGFDASVTDSDLKCLDNLTQLQSLDLEATQVTDAGLEHLKGLTRLRRLSLDRTNITDAGLKHLKGLTQLQELRVAQIKITDAGLEHLAGLARIRLLDLSDSAVSAEFGGKGEITDAGLAHLTSLSQLRWLALGLTKITDAGLERLGRLSHLQDLDLGQTQITDAGLEHLKGLIQLESLDLNLTRATEAGVQKLQRALPNCHIHLHHVGF